MISSRPPAPRVASTVEGVSVGSSSLTGANLLGMTDDSSAAQSSGTLLTRMGIELLEVSAERAVGTMPVEGNTQPHGLLHGGASAVLAETLGSFAANAHAGTGRVAVGIALNITPHRSARTGSATAAATAVHP